MNQNVQSSEHDPDELDLLLTDLLLTDLLTCLPAAPDGGADDPKGSS